MASQQHLWWFTSAALVLLMLGTMLLEPPVLAALSGMLAIAGITLFRAYRHPGTLALIGAAVAAAIVAAAVHLGR